MKGWESNILPTATDPEPQVHVPRASEHWLEPSRAFCFLPTAPVHEKHPRLSKHMVTRPLHSQKGNVPVPQARRATHRRGHEGPGLGPPPWCLRCVRAGPPSWATGSRHMAIHQSQPEPLKHNQTGKFAEHSQPWATHSLLPSWP